MSRSKRLVFFGNERLATGTATSVPSLRALIEAGYDILAVVASHQNATSRAPRELEVAQVAKRYNIPLVMPASKSELINEVQKYPAEIGVLVAYGKIIPQEVIDLFSSGIINIHPSLLPKYRGPTPIETALLDGAYETGVSIMSLSAEMDAGPIYAQEKIALKGNETKQDLADKLLHLGTKLLIKHLALILDGSLEPKLQDESAATYTKLITKQDGLINFSKSAEILEREVRAYAGWPKSQAKLKHYDVILTKVRVAQAAGDGELVHECGEGWLELLELVGPSGRTMSGADFIRGYAKN